jgi:hypothetical protein
LPRPIPAASERAAGSPWKGAPEERAAKSRPDMLEINETRPRVILDIDFSNGLFFMSIRNIGSQPAFRLRPKLDRRIVGLGGRKEVNKLNILKGIEFVPPGKEFRFLLDSAASYFARKQPTRFHVNLSYTDSSGKRYREKIGHNLEIYRDLPFTM